MIVEVAAVRGCVVCMPVLHSGGRRGWLGKLLYVVYVRSAARCEAIINTADVRPCRVGGESSLQWEREREGGISRMAGACLGERADAVAAAAGQLAGSDVRRWPHHHVEALAVRIVLLSVSLSSSKTPIDVAVNSSGSSVTFIHDVFFGVVISAFVIVQWFGRYEFAFIHRRSPSLW